MVTYTDEQPPENAGVKGSFLGHAVVARLVGLRVFTVVFGSGRQLLAWRFRNINWELHLWPLGGVTILAGPASRYYRLRDFVTVADQAKINDVPGIMNTRARTYEEARGVAKAVANSPLLKAAVNGNDPNVGRLLCAVGKHAGAHGLPLDPAKVRMKVGGSSITGKVDMAQIRDSGVGALLPHDGAQTHPLPDSAGESAGGREPWSLDAVANELQ